MDNLPSFKKFILVVNGNFHWSTAYINFDQEKICIYDSSPDITRSEKILPVRLTSLVFFPSNPKAGFNVASSASK